MRTTSARRFKHALLAILTGAALATTLTAHAAGPSTKDYEALDEQVDTLTQARQVLIFEARAGDSLRSTLNAWSKRAGWAAPQWKIPAETDFAMGATIRFEGDYKTATRAFINALGSDASLQVSFDVPSRSAVISLKPASYPADKSD